MRRISRTGMAFAFAALVAAAAPSATARSGAYLDTFDIYFGGIRAGEVAIDMKIEDGVYRARSNLVSAGVVGYFYDAFYEAEAEGALPLPKKPRPKRFEAKSAFGGKRQDLTIHFGMTGPKKVEADPPYKEKPYQIEPAAQLGAVDPLSAVVALVAPTPRDELCDREVTVFDGRHRIDIRLDRPEEQAGAIRCDAVFKRVAGFRPKDMKKQTDFPFRVYFRPWEDGLARLDQIVVETRFGLAVARRKD